MVGIVLAVFFLITILSTIMVQGKKAFFSTYIKLEVFFDPQIIDPDNTKRDEDIRFANFKKIIDHSLEKYFKGVTKKQEKRILSSLISSSEQNNLLNLVLNNKDLIGIKKELWLLASSKIDVVNKNPNMENLIEEDRLITNIELAWMKKLKLKTGLKMR